MGGGGGGVGGSGHGVSVVDFSMSRDFPIFRVSPCSGVSFGEILGFFKTRFINIRLYIINI